MVCYRDWLRPDVGTQFFLHAHFDDVKWKKAAFMLERRLCTQKHLHRKKNGFPQLDAAGDEIYWSLPFAAHDFHLTSGTCLCLGGTHDGLLFPISLKNESSFKSPFLRVTAIPAWNIPAITISEWSTNQRLNTIFITLTGAVLNRVSVHLSGRCCFKSYGRRGSLKVAVCVTV